MIGVSDARLLWAVGLNQLLTVGQVVAGVFSGSIALLSDAAHNFNDANALLIAYIARRISRKEANERYTFGYRRAEMIGALINLTLLAVIGLYVVMEGLKRLFQPEEIVGWVMAATAVLALAVDIGTALLLWTMSRGSLNVRAAFVHNIVDALGSVAVLLAAVAIIWFNGVWVDAVITLLIAGYVLWQVIRMFPQATRVLMEGTPTKLDLNTVIADVTAVDGVAGIHHLHVWELDDQHQPWKLTCGSPKAALAKWKRSSVRSKHVCQTITGSGIPRWSLKSVIQRTVMIHRPSCLIKNLSVNLCPIRGHGTLTMTKSGRFCRTRRR